jgi:hypothetical protein
LLTENSKQLFEVIEKCKNTEKLSCLVFIHVKNKHLGTLFCILLQGESICAVLNRNGEFYLKPIISASGETCTSGSEVHSLQNISTAEDTSASGRRISLETAWNHWKSKTILTMISKQTQLS